MVLPRHEFSGGGRITSAFGRRVLAAALAGVDEVGRRAVLAETTWRSGYLGHFHRVLEAGLTSPEAAVAIAGGPGCLR